MFPGGGMPGAMLLAMLLYGSLHCHAGLLDSRHYASDRIKYDSAAMYQALTLNEDGLCKAGCQHCMHFLTANAHSHT